MGVASKPKLGQKSKSLLNVRRARTALWPFTNHKITLCGDLQLRRSPPFYMTYGDMQVAVFQFIYPNSFVRIVARMLLPQRLGLKLKTVSDLQAACDQSSNFFCSLVWKTTFVGTVLALFFLWLFESEQLSTSGGASCRAESCGSSVDWSWELLSSLGPWGTWHMNLKWPIKWYKIQWIERDCRVLWSLLGLKILSYVFGFSHSLTPSVCLL